MDYASGVWGYRKYDRPQVIQNRAGRAFLGVHRFTSNVVVNGDMGWITPDVRRKLNMLRLWVRIEKMDDHRLTKKVYKWDKECKANNWNRDLKRLCKEIGKPELLSSHVDTVNVKELIECAENTLMEKVVSSWEKDLQSQNKLRTYRLYKSEYKPENYVCMNLSKNVRSKLAKLRSSTLPLRIETGRFERLAVSDRLCKFCDVIPANVETEYHFVFECTKYNTERAVLFNHVFNLYPNFLNLEIPEKWDIVMNNKQILPKTGQFIVNAMEVRNSVLYDKM